METPTPDQTTPVAASKSRKLFLWAGAAGLLGMAAVALVLIPRAESPSTTVAEVVASCQRQDTSVDINCVHNSIPLLPTEAPAELPGLLLAQVQSHTDMNDDCHNLMHTLGRHLATQAADLARDLTSEWEPCGYGFLHGVFESQKVPTDSSQAGDQLSGLCSIGKLSESERLRGECYHALGHAVSDSQTDLLTAIDVCKNAFTDQSEYGSSARIGCYSGVAMKERDKVLYELKQGREVAATVQAFKEAGAVCELEGEEFTLGCAPGFVQIATEYGPTHIGPFLTWCSDLLGVQAKTCYEQAGIYMGHFREKFYPLDNAVELCGAGDPQYAAACSVSLTQGLINRGYTATDALNQVCASFDTALTGPLEGQGEWLCQQARSMYQAPGGA